MIDRVTGEKPIRTQTKGVKPLKYHEAGNDLSIYTYLADVDYQVEAHFEWNEARPELRDDWVDGSITPSPTHAGSRRAAGHLPRTRECQGYVDLCLR